MPLLALGVRLLGLIKLLLRLIILLLSLIILLLRLIILLLGLIIWLLTLDWLTLIHRWTMNLGRLWLQVRSPRISIYFRNCWGRGRRWMKEPPVRVPIIVIIATTDCWRYGWKGVGSGTTCSVVEILILEMGFGGRWRVSSGGSMSRDWRLRVRITILMLTGLKSRLLRALISACRHTESVLLLHRLGWIQGSRRPRRRVLGRCCPPAVTFSDA